MTISSGRGKTDKSDVKTATHNVECKYTEKSFYSLNIKTWEKVRREAQKEFREPMMAIRLKDRDFIVTEEKIAPKKTDTSKSKRVTSTGEITLTGDVLEYTLKVQTMEEYLEAN